MSLEKYQYFKVYKPYGMLSQFTNNEGRPTLKDLYSFPADVYPVGRLDADSEGLLLLTNDKALTDALLNPLNMHQREYWVQVEGSPDMEAIKALESGVQIKGRKTLPAKVEIIPALTVPPRDPPIRFRKNVRETWLKVILTEGKNRQVRRMTAAVGYPTLRLIRIRIEQVVLGRLAQGAVERLTETEIKHLRKLKKAAK